MKGKIFLIVLVGLFMAGCFVTLTVEEARQIAEPYDLPIIIDSFRRSFPDSVGGVDLEMTLINVSKKPIKYVEVSVVGINSVGDSVYDEVRHEKVRTMRCIGPIEPGDTPIYHFENLWYSNIIASHGVGAVKVTFMDGAVVEITEVEQLKAVSPPHSVPGGAD